MTDQLSTDLASLRIVRDEPTRPSVLRRAIWPLIVIAILGVGGAAAATNLRKVEGIVFKQEVKTTTIAIISPSQVDVLVTATGYVIPQLTSKVSTTNAGRIAKVKVKEGDVVKAGDLIAQLENSDQRSQLRAAGTRAMAAQARSATARANIAELDLQIERERELVATGTVSKANLDSLLARQATLRQTEKAAEADTIVSQADMGVVGVGLKEREIRAPIDGKIVGKPAAIGELVGIGGNVPFIAEIIDFDSMMVETDVPEGRLHNIKIGAPCEIVLDAYPNQRYRGFAVELGQRVNRAKGTVTVKVKFADDHDGVLPEMSARVSFLAKSIGDAEKKESPKKVAPEESIVERNGRKVIFTVENSTLHAFPVRVGEKVGTAGLVELLDGPPEGARIVAKPTNETADGQKIKETDT